jgi:hypothetical protein
VIQLPFAQGDTIAVTGNDLASAVTGNDVNNRLSVSAATLAAGSGHVDAQAGALTSGRGAAADFALASQQVLDSSAVRPVTLQASTVGRFAAAPGALAQNSTIELSGNSQSAHVSGNLADSLLTLSAAQLGEGGSGAPGSALANLQSGNATLRAASDMVLEGAGNGSGNTLSIKANTNAAAAAMNEASNRLVVDAAQLASLNSASGATQAGGTGASLVAGDHVLASEQDAAGLVLADATTAARSNNPASEFDFGTMELSGNRTDARAAANKALNSIDMGTAATGTADAALLNVQNSDAAVLASAASDIGWSGSGQSHSTMLVSGNATSALAQGNTANNALSQQSLGPISGTAQALVAMPANSASGGALISNNQTNAGAITALASNVDYGGVLNCLGVETASLGLEGNLVTAAAAGNAATNTLTSGGNSGGLVLDSVQRNSGAVTARVSGAAFSFAVWPAANGSRLSASSNTVSASAIGNLAVNSIGAPR